MDYVS
jgi:ribosomal protein L12E/L44/L45/RPP1/RPP2